VFDFISSSQEEILFVFHNSPMETSFNRQMILVPKAALDPGRQSRNRLLDLLVKAGYDKVLGGFDRRDEIAQDDFVFRGVKGPEALASQLEIFQDRSVGVMMGTDVLAEADLIAQSYGVRSDIQRLISLGIGLCSLTFLAPEEAPVLCADDLRGRKIFTKYPALLQIILRSMRVPASVRKTDGADTRVNECRNELFVAALEIVESGATAEENRLQIVEKQLAFPTGEELRLPYLSLPSISTDLSVTRIGQMTDFSRGALRELGLALESARRTNRYVAMSFNVPAELVDRFRDLGLRGPTASKVIANDGAEWRALQIYVPLDRKNAMRSELLRRGAQDLSSSDALNVEISAEQSEVLRILPFEGDGGGACGTVLSERPQWGALAEVLLEEDDIIRQRAEMNNPSSGTCRALQKGTEFCVGKCMEEFIEVLESLLSTSESDDDRIIEEAADLLYRFLVALRSRNVGLRDMVDGLPVEVSAAAPEEGNDAYSLTRFLNQSDVAGRPAASFSIAAWGELFKAVTDFSTTIRKKKDDEIIIALRSGADFLLQILSLLSQRGVNPEKIVEALRRRRGPLPARVDCTDGKTSLQ